MAYFSTDDEHSGGKPERHRHAWVFLYSYVTHQKQDDRPVTQQHL